MVYTNHFLIQITTKDQGVVWGAFDEPDANPENLPESEVIQTFHVRFEHFSHLKKPVYASWMADLNTFGSKNFGTCI